MHQTFGLSVLARWLKVSIVWMRFLSLDAFLSWWPDASSSSMSDLIEMVSAMSSMLLRLFIIAAISSSVISSSLKSSSNSSNSPSDVSRSFFACATSLCSASYVSWQRGTTRIRPPHAATAAHQTAINRHPLTARPTAANLQERICCCGPTLGQTGEQTDGHQKHDASGGHSIPKFKSYFHSHGIPTGLFLSPPRSHAHTAKQQSVNANSRQSSNSKPCLQSSVKKFVSYGEIVQQPNNASLQQ